MVSRKDPLPVYRQCELLDLPRSTFYYRPRPVPEADLELMRLIDECHLQRPFFGSRRVRDWLEDLGYVISRKKVQHLMRAMGLTALYPKRNLSKRHQAHKVYPYLLKGLVIDRPNQVWAADVTYIPMAKGFLYLVAIIDWYSRKVLAWALSNSLDARFCVEALETALETYGRPDIFNTDQGSQFTSEAFTSALKDHDIRISMDGKGRWVDNVFVERLWRSLKYEEVYLKGYGTVAEATKSISDYLHFFNRERRHQALQRQTPDQVYFKAADQRMAA
jgi:putative transposase